MTDTTALTRLQARREADTAMLAHLGIEVDENSLRTRDPNAVKLALTVRGVLVNAVGFCHGGVLYALADTACAYALGAAGMTPATVDASVSYLRAARQGDRVQASCEVLASGRRHGTCEVRLHNQDGELLVVYRGTCAEIGAPRGPAQDGAAS